MRAPHRKRPPKKAIEIPPGTDLEELSLQASYVGSPEHKNQPSFAGQPKLRPDASCCPPEIADQEAVTEWLRDALRRGAVGAPWEGHNLQFPRYVWYKHGTTLFEGRLVNRESGHYKGYPLHRDEWPNNIDAIYE